MNWIELPATRGAERLVNADRIVAIRAALNGGTIIELAGAEHIITPETYDSLKSRLINL